MTVCIAAMCEGGRKIVTASDGLLTLGGVTADVLLAKFWWLGPWQFMYAGAPGIVGLIFEELRTTELTDPECLKREHIQKTVRFAYASVRADISAHAVLGPLGISLEDFNRYGAKRYGEGNFADLQARMTHHSNEMMRDQVMVCGWGARENAAMLFTVSPHGMFSDDATGSAAIGSGAEVALSNLLLLGQSRDSSLAETLYSVAAAKFMSESSAGEFVGQRTAIYISWKKPDADGKSAPSSGVFLQRKDIKPLREIWEEYGKPKIPDQARLTTTSILGRLNVDISPRDAFMSMKATARIVNQCRGRTSNAEEDDSGSTSTEEEPTDTEE